MRIWEERDVWDRDIHASWLQKRESKIACPFQRKEKKTAKKREKDRKKKNVILSDFFSRDKDWETNKNNEKRTTYITATSKVNCLRHTHSVSQTEKSEKSEKSMQYPPFFFVVLLCQRFVRESRISRQRSDTTGKRAQERSCSSRHWQNNSRRLSSSLSLLLSVFSLRLLSQEREALLQSSWVSRRIQLHVLLALSVSSSSSSSSSFLNTQSETLAWETSNFTASFTTVIVFSSCFITCFWISCRIQT